MILAMHVSVSSTDVFGEVDLDVSDRSALAPPFALIVL
jgi:hypothetical protein